MSTWVRRRPRALAACIAWVAGLAVASAATPGSIAAPDGPRRFAITGGRVVTGTGDVIQNGTVVIDGGLIAAVGSADTVQVPAGAWILEAEGKHVYPGWIDAMASVAASKSEGRQESSEDRDADAPFASGPEDRPGTTSWRNAADEWKLDEDRAASWRASGFTSAVIVPSGGIFPGQAALVNFGSGRDRETVVATPLALRVSFEVPGNRRSFPGSLMGILAYVRQSFFDAAHYGASWTAYEADPKGKPRPEYDRALGPLDRAIREDWPVLFPGHREHEVRRAVALAREVGAERPLVYGLHEGYAIASFLAAESVPALVGLDWPEAPEDPDAEAEVPLRELRLRVKAPSSPAALEEAGVRFAFYSDGLSAGEALEALRKAVASGLSRPEAVRALTLHAAVLFGVGDRLGSLEAGKIANVLVASGDLFEEDTRVETVFVDGVKYEIPETEPSEEEKEEGT